jgi:hypothetical protein
MGDQISNPNSFIDEFDFEDYEGTRDWAEASRRPLRKRFSNAVVSCNRSGAAVLCGAGI